MKNIECPYTEEMIDSENKFLQCLEKFIKSSEEIKLKLNTKKTTTIGTLVPMQIGRNKGEKVPIELKKRLEREISKDIKNTDLTKPDYESPIIVVRKWWSRIMCSH